MHLPVLYQEIIHVLRPCGEGRYVDGTVGAGGHAAGILEASSPGGLLLGLDVDPQALSLAKKRLAPFGKRVILRRESYVDFQDRLAELGWASVDGFLLDLGISSMQVETPERGFSFRFDAPLDMRFDPDASPTAADLVNSLPEKKLAEILRLYGEEPQARRIARAIVHARPIQTTLQLAELVRSMTGKSRTHPATRTFQALRIAVNRELEAVERVLPLAVNALSPGGRLAVIAFHSLEDRIVKRFFRQESRDCLCPPKQPLCTCGHKAVIKLITKKPIRPAPGEVEANPRARSARLRVAEKLPVDHH